MPAGLPSIRSSSATGGSKLKREDKSPQRRPLSTTPAVGRNPAAAATIIDRKKKKQNRDRAIHELAMSTYIKTRCQEQSHPLSRIGKRSEDADPRSLRVLWCLQETMRLAALHAARDERADGASPSLLFEPGQGITMDMSTCTLVENDLVSVSFVASSHPNITAMDLSGQALSATSCYAVCQILEENRNVVQLTLRAGGVDDQCLELIHFGLHQNQERALVRHRLLARRHLRDRHRENIDIFCENMERFLMLELERRRNLGTDETAEFEGISVSAVHRKKQSLRRQGKRQRAEAVADRIKVTTEREARFRSIILLNFCDETLKMTELEAELSRAVDGVIEQGQRARMKELEVREWVVARRAENARWNQERLDREAAEETEARKRTAVIYAWESKIPMFTEVIAAEHADAKEREEMRLDRERRDALAKRRAEELAAEQKAKEEGLRLAGVVRMKQEQRKNRERAEASAAGALKYCNNDQGIVTKLLEECFVQIERPFLLSWNRYTAAAIALHAHMAVAPRVTVHLAQAPCREAGYVYFLGDEEPLSVLAGAKINASLGSSWEGTYGDVSRTAVEAETLMKQSLKKLDTARGNLDSGVSATRATVSDAFGRAAYDDAVAFVNERLDQLARYPFVPLGTLPTSEAITAEKLSVSSVAIRVHARPTNPAPRAALPADGKVVMIVDDDGEVLDDSSRLISLSPWKTTSSVGASRGLTPGMSPHSTSPAQPALFPPNGEAYQRPSRRGSAVTFAGAGAPAELPQVQRRFVKHHIGAESARLRRRQSSSNMLTTTANSSFNDSYTMPMHRHGSSSKQPRALQISSVAPAALRREVANTGAPCIELYAESLPGVPLSTLDVQQELQSIRFRSACFEGAPAREAEFMPHLARVVIKCEMNLTFATNGLPAFHEMGLTLPPPAAGRVRRAKSVMPGASNMASPVVIQPQAPGSRQQSVDATFFSPDRTSSLNGSVNAGGEPERDGSSVALSFNFTLNVTVRLPVLWMPLSHRRVAVEIGAAQGLCDLMPLDHTVCILPPPSAPVALPSGQPLALLATSGRSLDGWQVHFSLKPPARAKTSLGGMGTIGFISHPPISVVSRGTAGAPGRNQGARRQGIMYESRLVAEVIDGHFGICSATRGISADDDVTTGAPTSSVTLRFLGVIDDENPDAAATPSAAANVMRQVLSHVRFWKSDDDGDDEQLLVTSGLSALSASDVGSTGVARAAGPSGVFDPTCPPDVTHTAIEQRSTELHMTVEDTGSTHSRTVFAIDLFRREDPPTLTSRDNIVTLRRPPYRLPAMLLPALNDFDFDTISVRPFLHTTLVVTDCEHGFYGGDLIVELNEADTGDQLVLAPYTDAASPMPALSIIGDSDSQRGSGSRRGSGGRGQPGALTVSLSVDPLFDFVQSGSDDGDAESDSSSAASELLPQQSFGGPGARRVKSGVKAREPKFPWCGKVALNGVVLADFDVRDDRRAISIHFTKNRGESGTEAPCTVAFVRHLLQATTLRSRADCRDMNRIVTISFRVGNKLVPLPSMSGPVTPVEMPSSDTEPVSDSGDDGDNGGAHLLPAPTLVLNATNNSTRGRSIAFLPTIDDGCASLGPLRASKDESLWSAMGRDEMIVRLGPALLTPSDTLASQGYLEYVEGSGATRILHGNVEASKRLEADETMQVQSGSFLSVNIGRGFCATSNGAGGDALSIKRVDDVNFGKARQALAAGRSGTISMARRQALSVVNHSLACRLRTAPFLLEAEDVDQLHRLSIASLRAPIDTLLASTFDDTNGLAASGSNNRNQSLSVSNLRPESSFSRRVSSVLTPTPISPNAQVRDLIVHGETVGFVLSTPRHVLMIFDLETTVRRRDVTAMLRSVSFSGTTEVGVSAATSPVVASRPPSASGGATSFDNVGPTDDDLTDFTRKELHVSFEDASQCAALVSVPVEVLSPLQLTRVIARSTAMASTSPQLLTHTLPLPVALDAPHPILWREGQSWSEAFIGGVQPCSYLETLLEVSQPVTHTVLAAQLLDKGKRPIANPHLRHVAAMVTALKGVRWNGGHISMALEGQAAPSAFDQTTMTPASALQRAMSLSGLGQSAALSGTSSNAQAPFALHFMDPQQQAVLSDFLALPRGQPMPEDAALMMKRRLYLQPVSRSKRRAAFNVFLVVQVDPNASRRQSMAGATLADMSKSGARTCATPYFVGVLRLFSAAAAMLESELGGENGEHIMCDEEEDEDEPLVIDSGDDAKDPFAGSATDDESAPKTSLPGSNVSSGSFHIDGDPNAPPPPQGTSSVSFVAKPPVGDGRSPEERQSYAMTAAVAEWATKAATLHFAPDEQRSVDLPGDLIGLCGGTDMASARNLTHTDLRYCLSCFTVQHVGQSATDSGAPSMQASISPEAAATGSPARAARSWAASAVATSVMVRLQPSSSGGGTTGTMPMAGRTRVPLNISREQPFGQQLGVAADNAAASTRKSALGSNLARSKRSGSFTGATHAVLRRFDRVVVSSTPPVIPTGNPAPALLHPALQLNLPQLLGSTETIVALRMYVSIVNVEAHAMLPSELVRAASVGAPGKAAEIGATYESVSGVMSAKQTLYAVPDDGNFGKVAAHRLSLSLNGMDRMAYHLKENTLCFGAQPVASVVNKGGLSLNIGISTSVQKAARWRHVQDIFKGITLGLLPNKQGRASADESAATPAATPATGPLGTPPTQKSPAVLAIDAAGTTPSASMTPHSPALEWGLLRKTIAKGPIEFAFRDEELNEIGAVAARVVIEDGGADPLIAFVPLSFKDNVRVLSSELESAVNRRDSRQNRHGFTALDNAAPDDSFNGTSGPMDIVVAVPAVADSAGATAVDPLSTSENAAVASGEAEMAKEEISAIFARVLGNLDE
jgi:hypothetical protein